MKKLSVIAALCIMFVSADVRAQLIPPPQLIERQLQDNWCWVASVQSLLMQVNRYLPQPVIAARFTGVPYNRPASIQEVIALLQSYGFRAWEAGYPPSPQQLAGTLSSGWKLIAFVRPTNGPVGHFIVLQGLDPMSGGIITSDPWTGQTLLNSINQLYYAWHWIDFNRRRRSGHAPVITPCRLTHSGRSPPQVSRMRREGSGARCRELQTCRLAKRYLDIMATARFAGPPTDADEYTAQVAVIEAFNELYPPRTDARESILFDCASRIMERGEVTSSAPTRADIPSTSTTQLSS